MDLLIAFMGSGFITLSFIYAWNGALWRSLAASTGGTTLAYLPPILEAVLRYLIF